MEGHLTAFLSLASLSIAGFILYRDLNEVGLFDRFKENDMNAINCLARAELSNGRSYPLLVFPDQVHDAKKASVECWSPMGGHSWCDKPYVLEHTKNLDEAEATKLIARYEEQYQSSLDFRLKRLTSWPK